MRFNFRWNGDRIRKIDDIRTLIKKNLDEFTTRLDKSNKSE